MKMWLIRFKTWEYDDFDAFVIAAESEADVVAMLRDEATEHYRQPAEESYYSHTVEKYQWEAGYTISEVPLDQPRIILGSFNAG